MFCFPISVLVWFELRQCGPPNIFSAPLGRKTWQSIRKIHSQVLQYSCIVIISSSTQQNTINGNKMQERNTGRNVRFACLQIYCKSCYKFQICNDLPHLHACKLLICTRSKLGGKCGNGREAVRRKSVANPLQTNYFATSLHACKLKANTKFASDLHIRKSVDNIKLANGL